MSSYMMLPKDYIKGLYKANKAKKAGAFVEYAMALDEKKINSIRFYAESWDVTKSTAERWIKEFRDEIAEHYDFWASHNKKSHEKTVKKSGTPNGTPNGTAKPLSDGTSSSECGTPNGTLNGTNINTNINIYSRVVDFLNETINTKYTSTSKKTRSLINARLNDGFTLEDFKSVISKKARAWKTDHRMSVYLRPETLFGTKFESYLNEIESSDNGGVIWQ